MKQLKICMLGKTEWSKFYKVNYLIFDTLKIWFVQKNALVRGCKEGKNPMTFSSYKGVEGESTSTTVNRCPSFVWAEAFSSYIVQQDTSAWPGLIHIWVIICDEYKQPGPGQTVRHGILFILSLT